MLMPARRLPFCLQIAISLCTPGVQRFVILHTARSSCTDPLWTHCARRSARFWPPLCLPPHSVSLAHYTLLSKQRENAFTKVRSRQSLSKILSFSSKIAIYVCQQLKRLLNRRYFFFYFDVSIFVLLRKKVCAPHILLWILSEGCIRRATYISHKFVPLSWKFKQFSHTASHQSKAQSAN